MLLYIIVIAAVNILTALINWLAEGTAFPHLFIWLARTAAATVAVILLDGIGAFLIRRLPEKMFAPGKAVFNVGKAERRFYRKIMVNSWSDKVPELGGFTDFHKDRFESPSDTRYLARFLLESNYGAVIHLENTLSGIALIFVPPFGGLGVTLPVAVTNLVLSMLPFFILRNNTPPLLALYRRSLRK